MSSCRGEVLKLGYAMARKGGTSNIGVRNSCADSPPETRACAAT